MINCAICLKKLESELISYISVEDGPEFQNDPFTCIECSSDPGFNIFAQELSKLGAAKGGFSRAKKLSPKRRSEIAKKAALSRWKLNQGK